MTARQVTELLGDDELRAAARELAERSAASQGVPARITDRGVLERVARLARGER